MTFKRYRPENKSQHPYSLSALSWQQAKIMPWSSEHEKRFMDELHQSYEEGTWFNRKFLLENKLIKSPEIVRKQLGLDPNKKTAVIYSHVLWDATFFFGESLFEDYEHWLIETVKIAKENPAVNWVIKLHPDYVWKMKQMGQDVKPRDIIALDTRIGRLPDHIIVVPPDTDISTYAFFLITDYCITVRGTVGIETPCFGIRTFTAGTGRYAGLGFTEDSVTREEYLHKMRHIHEFGRLSAAETTLARRHAYALFKLRLLPFESFDMAPPSLKHIGSGLDHNIVVHTKSFDELSAAKDLRAFAGWVLRSRTEDFPDPAWHASRTGYG